MATSYCMEEIQNFNYPYLYLFNIQINLHPSCWTLASGKKDTTLTWLSYGHSLMDQPHTRTHLRSYARLEFQLEHWTKPSCLNTYRVYILKSLVCLRIFQPTLVYSTEFFSNLPANASFQLGKWGWRLVFDVQESLCLLLNNLGRYELAPTMHPH